MLKKTITYEDFNGVTHTEDFYFNLTTAELTELQLSKAGGFDAYLKRIVDAQDIPTLSQAFKEIILMSYGEKSEDGKRFVKKAPDGHKLADDFVDSAAYAALYTELFTNDTAAADFVNSIIPANIGKVNPSHPALTTNK